MPRTVVSICGALACAAAAASSASSGEPVAPTVAQAGQRDGQHDFDWEFGLWKTDMRRLKKPLSGSSDWLHYTGTTKVAQIWGGKANMVELSVDGPTGHFEAINLRLYNPTTRLWSLYYANAAAGSVSMPPLVGGFDGKRGLFYDEEEYGGRKVLVRFIITIVDRDTARFEQAFSADGGHNWETNWIVTDTRIQGTG